MSKEQLCSPPWISATIFRQLAVLSVLIVLCAAFAYDSLLVRPNFRNAWEALERFDALR